ncbi:MAG: GMC oxidoreductase [Myxococcales bacterium]|nr:GMC oxidoreductase [Myxococcales bacterium]
MRSQPAPRTECFSPRERRGLAAVAETAVPAGRVFPGAGEACIAKVERYLADAGTAASTGYRALFYALDGAAILKHARGYENLTPGERLALLDSWRTANYARRTALRALLAPIKISHFNDPEIYRHVGCVYGITPPATIERPRYLDRALSAADVAGETLECDVVVIGTGAGGAVVARELAEQGVAVVMLEEGEWYTRADFNGHAIEMQKKMFRDMGATISVGNVAIPIPIGRTVGGTTTINSGTCYRAPERVLKSWRDQHGLSDFSSEMLDPYYRRVEEVLGVAEARGEFLGGIARLIGRGCDALGYQHKPLRRNAPDCDGKGVCCFGCPTDAKRSTNVSYVPLALRAGATLVKGVRADEVLCERGRAVGVKASARGGVQVTVRAKAVVASCGSLMTPVFLLGNGLANSSGQVGKNLSIHPAAALFARFDEDVSGFNAIPQGYSIEHFHDEGLLFEGAFAPLDVGAASITHIGPTFTDMMESYDRLACFGFMIEDSSRGRVRRGPGGKPLITYMLNRHDVARMKRGVEILGRIFFAAGARTVYPALNGFDEWHSLADMEPFYRATLHARDFDISAYHPLGTARMGLDAHTSVVGPDHQSHDVPGLYVVDGSAVPSSLAVNPQLTIMALATRAAEKLAARMG